MSSVLITGSSGFIGRALCEEMRICDWGVVEFDIVRSRKEDVRSKRALKRAIQGQRVDIVIHLAAEVGKLNCERHRQLAIDTNAFGTMQVAQVCDEMRIPMVFVSTSEVYGDHGQLWVDESGWQDSLGNFGDAFDGDPSGVYALTKRWGEEICQTYAPVGLKIIRPTMPYGPGVPPGPGRRALDNLVWQALTRQRMIVHDGAARSWCWVDDIARGIRYVIEQGKPGVYNVGRDDDEISMEDLAMRILRVIQRDEFGALSSYADLVEVVDPPTRQTAVKRIDCGKLRNLGWEPEVSLDDGLPLMVEWVKEWIGTLVS